MRNLQKYYNECIIELTNMGISTWEVPDVDLTISKRAKKRFGQCRFYNGEAYEINISEFLLDENITPDEDALKNTIIHEILHALTPGEHHSGEWKRLANLVTRRSGGKYNVKRTTSYEEKGIDRQKVQRPVKIRYILECVKCRKQYKHQRKGKAVKHPEWFRCGKCRGNLELVSLR